MRYGDSLTAAKRDRSAWNSLVGRVDHVVKQMPLWKLQTVGNSQLDFLYENRCNGTSVALRPGVAFCLRKFYGLVGDLVRSAWVRYIRRHNHDALGTTADLAEFLFGSERSDLGVVRTILEDVQGGRCFYCDRTMIRQTAQVDHFIPWTKYPLDLGHNFVLVHQTCNSAKADHLAAADYLVAWVERNIEHQSYLAEKFNQRGIMHDLSTSARIAEWIYRQTFEAGGLTWKTKNEMVVLPVNWKQPIVRLMANSA
jgi:hypothetical protein